jgi:hypothetical protein
MIGSLLAGVDESPGDVVLYQGERYKEYRGMGSLGAMKSPAARTATSRARSTDAEKLVPEGIEGRVPYKGPVRESSTSWSAACAPPWATAAAAPSPRAAAQRPVRAHDPPACARAHPHDVTITAEAPNYVEGRDDHRDQWFAGPDVGETGVGAQRDGIFGEVHIAERRQFRDWQALSSDRVAGLAADAPCSPVDVQE